MPTSARAALLLTSLALLTACGGAPEPDAAPQEPEAVLASPVALAEPARWQWRFAVAPDGQSALLGRSDGFFPQTREASIYEVRRTADGGWSAPQEVPFVGPKTSDIDPVWAPDGRRVWFSSIRAVGGARRDDVDVWSVDRRTDGSWAEPVHAAALSSAADDLYPSVGPDGSVYVGSDRGGSGFDLWRSPATGSTWGPAAPLPAPVTTSAWEFNPAFTPDGSALVFTSLSRPGAPGKGDLFVTRPAAAGWTEPVPLELVNTAADEYHPSFSPDGATLYFVRDGRLLQLPLPDGLP